MFLDEYRLPVDPYVANQLPRRWRRATKVVKEQQ
jgi:hypothetical protein